MKISTLFLAKTSFILSPKEDSAFKSLDPEEIARLLRLFPKGEMKVAIQGELRASYDKK